MTVKFVLLSDDYGPSTEVVHVEPIGPKLMFAVSIVVAKTRPEGDITTWCL